ncbi:hypothetical protein [Spiroplasma phoeniceum]|uniref:hypothetical protein n=1 Tax=Spiroplasma phoeniceum TaxID=47835 RepID=UPI000DF7C2E1|nr:hypothetical protein [Spiroplasma phoeniceum]
MQKIWLIFKKISNISLDEFSNLNDIDAVVILSDLAKTKIGNETILKINQYRLSYKFQKSLIENFIKMKRKIINSVKKINPFYWLEKLVNKLIDTIKKQLHTISEKISLSINKLVVNNSKKIIFELLIPCRPDSFLLGFKFEPIGLSGEGILEIYKKDYVSKKTGKISSYRPVRVFTTLLEVKQFATSEHQNSYYLDNWELGWGYRQ